MSLGGCQRDVGVRGEEAQPIVQPGGCTIAQKEARTLQAHLSEGHDCLEQRLMAGGDLLEAALDEGRGAKWATEDGDALNGALDARSGDVRRDVGVLLSARAPCSTLVSSQPQLLLGQKLLCSVNIPRNTRLVQSTIDVVHERTNEVVGEFLLQLDEGWMEA